MNQAEAVDRLVGAGQTQEIIALVDATQQRVADHYKQIDDDLRLNETAKLAEKAKIFLSADEEVNKKLEGLATRVTRTDRDDAERVFGTRGLAGDAASLTISRRDAADRVGRVDSREELRALLTSATRTGDDVLARAIVEHGVANEDVETVNQFIAAYPDLEAATERLWSAANSSRTNSMGILFGLASLRPNAFSGWTRAAIERTAKSVG